MNTKAFFHAFSPLLLALILLAAQTGCAPMTPQPAVTQPGPGPTPTPSISPARLIENASQTLANQLVSNLPADKKLRIGIVPFSDKTGQAGTLAQALQESLRNQLFLSKRFDVVEDTDMQKVLRELRIQEQGQGVLSQETIQRMGELLAAEAVVVGTITDLYQARVSS